jgi:hypothetical protein
MNRIDSNNGQLVTVGDHAGPTVSGDAPSAMARDVGFAGLARSVAANRFARARQLRRVRGIVRSISNQSAEHG